MGILKTIAAIFIFALLGTSAFGADCNSGIRYKDNGNGTVTDCKSGLVWLKDADCKGTANDVTPGEYGLTWVAATKWTAGLGNGICGLTDGSSAGDWRLPTKAEWEAMVADAKSSGYYHPALTNSAGTAKWSEGDVFNHVRGDYGHYWSSTQAQNYTYTAWHMYTYSGNMILPNSTHSYVWPVRGRK